MSRKIVTVTWGDAWSQVAEVSLDEIKAAARPTVIHTMGYVVLENPEVIVIAGEWLPPHKPGDNETFRNVTIIPKPWIIKKTQRRKKSAVEVVPSVPAAERVV